MFEERDFLLKFVFPFSMGIFDCSWWPFLLSWGSSFLQKLFILLKPNNKLAKTFTYGNTHFIPLILIEFFCFKSLTIIIKAYWCLNGECECYFQVLEHDCSCSLFFLFVDCKGTTVKTKVRVYFFDEFREDTAFIVIRLTQIVCWPIEKRIFFSWMTMKI